MNSRLRLITLWDMQCHVHHIHRGSEDREHLARRERAQRGLGHWHRVRPHLPAPALAHGLQALRDHHQPPHRLHHQHGSLDELVRCYVADHGMSMQCQCGGDETDR